MLNMTKCWHHQSFWRHQSLFNNQTWGTSMKFSEKMWIMIILKVAKYQGFTLSLEDIQKTTGGRGIKMTPPPSPPAVLGLNNCFLCLYIRNEKMLKYNAKFHFEDMAHMLNFLKHLGSWSCLVLHLLISLLWLTDYKGSL